MFYRRKKKLKIYCTAVVFNLVIRMEKKNRTRYALSTQGDIETSFVKEFNCA